MADKKLFIALWPDDRQRNNLRDNLGPLLASVEGRPVDRRNWHVTLVFIGRYPEEKIGELQATLQTIAVQPFRLRFDRLAFWPRPKIACLETLTVPDELKTLKQELDQALQPFGVEPETFEYRPHVTAVTAARSFPTVRLARPIELQWSDFQLMESVPAAGGVQYRPLKQ